MHDGTTWRKLPLPANLRAPAGSTDRLQVFFGRDDRPRLMGVRRPDGATDPRTGSAVYLRWRDERWATARSEIGKLGGAPEGPLWGVLGEDDPEVACKVGDVCIIKRRTGWTTIPALEPFARGYLCSGQPYATEASRVYRLDNSAWQPLFVSAPFHAPLTGFWAQSNEVQWVSVAGENALYRYANSTWTRFDSPVGAPEQLWGSGPNDVWVVGRDGAGHFDGTTWLCVEGIEGPLTEVVGRKSGEVWFGGGSGLWHGTGD